MQTPLIWFGGKSKIADDIISLMPTHKCYVEPFGGGASIMTTKDPSPFEVYNDIDGEVVNFLMVMRDNPERLANACVTLPYSRRLFEEWNYDESTRDNFQDAVRWFYLNRSGIAAGNRHRTGWRHSCYNNPASDYRSACDRLNDFAKRFAKIQIECRDFREVIKIYDSPETLFYVDPPYVGREHKYKGGFNEHDHRDLSNLLNRIKGKCLVSYYDDPLVDELYPGWNRSHIDTFNYSRPQDDGEERPRARELLLTNYGVIQQKLELAP